MLKQGFWCDVCKEYSPKGFRFEFKLNKVTVNGGVINGFLPVEHNVEVCSIDCAVKRFKKVAAPSFEPQPKSKVKEIKQDGKAVVNG